MCGHAKQAPKPPSSARDRPIATPNPRARPQRRPAANATLYKPLPAEAKKRPHIPDGPRHLDEGHRTVAISPAELCGSERVLGPTKRNQANIDCVSICEVLRTYKHDSLATTRQPGAGHRDDNGLPRATKWQGYWPPALSELASTRRGDVCRSGGAGLSHTRATFWMSWRYRRTTRPYDSTRRDETRTNRGAKRRSQQNDEETRRAPPRPTLPHCNQDSPSSWESGMLKTTPTRLPLIRGVADRCRATKRPNLRQNRKPLN